MLHKKPSFKVQANGNFLGVKRGDFKSSFCPSYDLNKKKDDM